MTRRTTATRMTTKITAIRMMATAVQILATIQEIIPQVLHQDQMPEQLHPTKLQRPEMLLH